MTSIEITKEISNQRLDKFLERFLPYSTKGNIYKMLRKKVICLNNKRAKGNERLKEGDIVSLFLSQESLDSLQKKDEIVIEKASPLTIVYEDENILIMDKPVGVLSQKANISDEDTLNDRLLYYLKDKVDLHLFSPGIANRLDRNTSGLIIAGKNLLASQQVNLFFQEGNIRRFYETIVLGNLEKEVTMETGYKREGRVTKVVEDGDSMISVIRPIKKIGKYTIVEVELKTGRTHQIRTHLSELGYPVIGDNKYGNPRENEKARRMGINSQILHAYRLLFTEKEGILGYLDDKEFLASPSTDIEKFLSRL